MEEIAPDFQRGYVSALESLTQAEALECLPISVSDSRWQAIRKVSCDLPAGASGMRSSAHGCPRTCGIGTTESSHEPRVSFTMMIYPPW